MKRWLSYLREHADGYLFGVIVFTLMAWAILSLNATINRQRLDQQPASDWIEYESIEFVRFDPDARSGQGGIVMQSTTTVNREGIALAFLDQLFCDNEFVSSQTTMAFVPEKRSRTTVWHYAGDWVPGDCVMRSTITAEDADVTKELQIESEPFTIP